LKKEFLNIYLHGTKQLEGLLNGKIVSREKLHHWPLSYVEKITMKDNTSFVYKSQRSAASVEKEFYFKFKAPFLTSPIYSEAYKNCDIMIMPYLDYPTMGEVSEDKLEEIAFDISRRIQDFSGLPVFFDLSSAEKLARVIDDVCVVFEGKGEDRNIAALKNWVSKTARLCYDNREIGNLHGDLNAANMLFENGKLRYLLDWQRPMSAPLLLENALAFRSVGYDAVKRYGDFGILALICHFIWYAYAYRELLPFDALYNTAQKLLLEFISIERGESLI